jgi:hypothetical protein
MIKHAYIPVLLFLFLWSCSTTEPVTEAEKEAASPYFELTDIILEEYVLENLDEFDRMLVESRSTLSDQFLDLDHDMPEIFTREVIKDDRDVDVYAGFRVQILSTRDVVHADTTKDNFMAWADSTIAGYAPEAYVFFRQPYYRVRAGDFHDRDMAIELSRLLKQFYPDAWVVHDRIEPNRVPADTAVIKYREPEDALQPVNTRRLNNR